MAQRQSRPTLPLAAALAASPSPSPTQPPLTQQERKALRAESQRLGKQLCTVQLGQNGLTPQFLDATWAALRANGLIKIKVQDCNNHDCCNGSATAGNWLLMVPPH